MSEKVIRFERGIPGFLDEKEFIYQMENEESPFGYLQSVKTDQLSFIVTSPFVFFADYAVELPVETIKRLQIESQEDVAILTIITLRGELSTATTNLLAPIVINLKNLQAEQFIQEGTSYTTRHLLFPPKPATVGGE